MTLVTLSLVFLMVAYVFISIHTQSVVTISPLVIRAPQHSTLVSSIAHTFLFRWFVQLTRTASNQRLASRHVTEWSQTHSLKVLQPVLVLLRRILTSTIVELSLTTLCNIKIGSTDYLKRRLRVPFFYINI